MPSAKKQGSNDAPQRRRGRPAGRNRVPLSLEERRARNAQYERERREETAAAMEELAAAVGCDPNSSNADVLAEAITFIKIHINRQSQENTDDLQRINGKLQAQIVFLQGKLEKEEASLKQANNVAPASIAVPPPVYFETPVHPSIKPQPKEDQDNILKKQSCASADSGIGSPTSDWNIHVMNILRRSLYEIPAIKFPGEESTDLSIQPGPSRVEDSGHCRTTVPSGCQSLAPIEPMILSEAGPQDTEISLDDLTDMEKAIVCQWLGELDDND